MQFDERQLGFLKHGIRDPALRLECIALLKDAFPDASSDDRIERTVDAIHAGSDAGIPRSGWCEVDQVILEESLLLLIEQPSEPITAHRRFREAGLRADILVQHSYIGHWSLLQAINYALLLNIRPSRRSAALVTMRDDEVSILEWIAHYRALQVDHIFVYTNDNADGSDAMLSALADSDVITLVWNRTSGVVSPQQKAYDHSLHSLHELRDYEWVLYLDSDEFLELGAQYSGSIDKLIDELEHRSPVRLPSAMGFNWHWYGSNRAFARVPGLLLERFEYAGSSHTIKCLARIADVVSMRFLHFPDLADDGFLVNSEFERVDMSKIWDPGTEKYGGGRLRHYWCKSFEEFSVKKARGDSLARNEATQYYHRDFKLFFDWNVDENEAAFFPAPAALVADVKREIAHLLTLPGVGAASRQTDAHFLRLLARYDSAGGLKAIYDACLSSTP